MASPYLCKSVGSINVWQNILFFKVFVSVVTKNVANAICLVGYRLELLGQHPLIPQPSPADTQLAKREQLRLTVVQHNEPDMNRPIQVSFRAVAKGIEIFTNILNFDEIAFA